MTDPAAALAKALADHRAGRPDLAEPVYRRLIEADPDHAEAHHLLAVVCLQTGRLDQALTPARLATDLAPGHAKAFNTLGNVLAGLGQRAEAALAFARAAELESQWADARLNLGVMLAGLGRSDEALAAFGHAARLAPNDPRPLVNSGAQLLSLKRPAEAETVLRRALELAPGSSEALNNLGQALTMLRRPGEAVEILRRGLDGAPGMAALHGNLGNALEALGEMAEAVACLRRAIALEPANPAPHHNLLVTLPFMDGIDAAAVFEEFKAFGRIHDHRFDPARPFLVDREPERDLRIAILSPSLCHHVLRQNLAPVIRCLPRHRARLCVYAHVPRPDEVTARMQADADEWTFVHALDDGQLAERIRRDRIDVLVHPMGHWSENRILALAGKPAPVMVSYLCNSPSTGLAAFDYTLVDRFLDFDGSLGALCVEEPVHLDSGFQVTEYDLAPPIGPPPSLANGVVTFGSFNNPAKLSDASLDLWAAVLNRVEGSRLMLKGGGLDDRALADRVVARFAARGIPAARLDLVGRVPGYGEHLALYGRVDIQLDTVPFTGGRTTEDALWMGVPVVTLAGQGVYGRFSWGHLCRIGHPELAARTPAEFVELAAALAADRDRLADYRRTLRPALQASSIMDFAGHAAELDRTFRWMWKTWCG